MPAERKIQLAFGLALLLTCSVGATSYYSLVRLRGDVAWVVHTQRTITVLESLFSSITDAVAAQRGYTIAGSSDFVERYRLALRDVHQNITTLRDLLADNPEQQERLAQLVLLVGEREKFADSVTELQRSGRAAEAHALISQGRGNEIHEHIRAVVNRLQDEERKLLDVREERAERATLAAQIAIVLGVVLSLMIVAGAIFLIARDFSGRRKADAALQDSLRTLEGLVEERGNQLDRATRSLSSNEARLEGILQSAMDAIIAVDQQQRIVLFNAAAEAIFRCRASDALGGPLERFIPERFRAAHRNHISRFGETGTTTRTMGARLQLFGLRFNGEEFPIDASISQVETGGQKFYTVILRDVTERKRAQDELERSHLELRELAAAMHEVREAERTRVARELHDELAQWLTAIKMDVAWLSTRLPREQLSLLEKTEKVKGLVDTTVAAVRRIASDLRPVMLDDLGLLPAVESLLHDLSGRTGIVVSLDAASDDLDFHEPLVTSVYRMIQEALTNVARHSGATEVTVAIRRSGDDVTVRIADNGRGFDPEAPGRRKSYGVLGIHERAYTLGGRATIVSRQGGGTVVEIVVPAARYRKRGRNDDSRAAG